MNSHKGNTGFKRVRKALFYSLAGFRAAWHFEAAFRQENLLSFVLIPLAFFLGDSAIHRSLMIASMLLVLIVELINSAIEATVDRISLEHHDLAKRAKDIGSAAVLVAFINLVLVWSLLLLK